MPQTCEVRRHPGAAPPSGDAPLAATAEIMQIMMGLA